MDRSRPVVAGLVAGLMILAGCAQQSPVPTPTPSSAAPSVTPTSTYTEPDDTELLSPDPSTTTSTPCLADAQAMSLDAQLGQLIMVGVTGGLDAAERKAIATVGSALLLGAHTEGLDAVAKLTGQLKAVAPETHLLIAADQEGGKVQRLSGAGFRRIPSAAKQATFEVESLQARARNWGRELAEAGVLLNLAPVADVVPEEMVKTNQPIAKLDRGFGSDPEVVSDKVRAVINGFAAAGVGTTAKHFPGLGAVAGNTDHRSGVTDTTTGSDSVELMPFHVAIEAGVNAVMISSARYTKIDPKNLAVFSPTVIALLRGYGFEGVVISDDLGAAAAVQSVPAKQRALRFVRAGGDLVITASPKLVAPMLAGLRAEAAAKPAFAAQVATSAARVLQLKQDLGLLACS